MTKLCCFNQDNPNFSAFQCHSELAEKRTGSMRRMIGSQALEISTRSTITSGAPCWKSTVKLQPKPKTTDEMKVALQTIWLELSQEHVNKAVANFTKCCIAYMSVATNGGHS